MTTTTDRSSRIRLLDKWKFVQLAVGLSLLLFVGFFLIGGFTEASNRHAIRWSARISVFLFSFAFAASALHRFFPSSFSLWTLQNRKYLGISFALIHLIHLALLGILQVSFHPVFDMAASTSLMGGGLAYLFVVLMLLTSFDRFSKYLSPSLWKALHTLGGSWIWLIFMISYTKRIMTEWEYFPQVLILTIVLLLRVANMGIKKA